MKLNKETRLQLAELIKELNKRREDLECEDLKVYTCILCDYII